VNDAARPDAPSLDDDLALAQRMADAADAISLDRFRSSDLRTSAKADHTFVTDADQAVERAIRELIATERPGDGILGEEYGSEGSSTRTWIIDPIDGTHNYLRGVPVWGTLIGLSVDGTASVGVASAPALGKRWWAAKGGGAWARATGGSAGRIHASDTADLEHASMSFQSIEQWDEAGHLDTLIGLSRTVWRDRAYGDFWAYTMLAEGLIDIVAEFGVHAYDVAALIPIVEEAGGRFTSTDGTDGPWDRTSLATNSLLHEPMLSAFRGA
jgi:histidinol-phosphatase